MNVNFYSLGHLNGGDVVEVTFHGSAANLRLMGSSDFNNYKNGRPHNYYGGLQQRSPARIGVPHSGTWYVDTQGLRGSTRSAVRVMPSSAMRPLAPMREPSLRDVPTLVRDPDADDLAPTPEAPDGRTFDVFISRASEDNDDIVRPLAHALRAGGLRVWYDDFELRIGDSLRRKIDPGLASSRFGVVVLSKSFIGKGWTEYELDGLVTRAVTGDQILLPVWHNVTKAEVVGYSPSLADRVARSTAILTVEEIAVEIVDVIRTPMAA